MCNAGSRPQGQAQAMLKLEKCHGTMLELFADDARAREPKAVAIEAQGCFQIIDTDGDHGDRRLH
jgi:hypothetical protein